MTNFDEMILRKTTDSVKWDKLDGDYIPMWVADMDFRSPQPMLDALEKRLKHGVFGYQLIPDELVNAIVAHYEKRFGCAISKDWLVWIPSVMPGANLACRVGGGKIMYNIPMYSHIRRLPAEAHTGVAEVMMKVIDGKYYMDIKAMEAALTSDVTTFILCNPHNPVGRVYTPEEISQVVDFCHRHRLLLVSDEIHGEIVFEGRHTPLISLGEKAKEHSITLTSAGKICNIPGLPYGFAIIPNAKLRATYEDICNGLFSPPNTLSVEALKCAFDGSCDEWKAELIEYLRENRDYLEKRISRIAGLSVVHNEGTYLAWIDCTGAGIPDPSDFFFRNARVYFNGSQEFGIVDGFVRCNFGCSKAQLAESLDRVEASLASR